MEFFVSGAQVRALTSVLDQEVMDMKVIVHARGVEAPEKMSIYREKYNLAFGSQDHGRAHREAGKKKPRKEHQGSPQKRTSEPGSLKRKEQMLCVKCNRKTMGDEACGNILGLADRRFLVPQISLNSLMLGLKEEIVKTTHICC